MSEDAEIVLVVDDTPQNIDILSNVLRSDFKVKAALNGQKALEIARKEPRPNIILLDIMMPEMDGFEVCKQLKDDPDTAAIPIVFITAMSDAEDETHGLELGAVDYINKPINPAVVLSRVKTHLHIAAQQRAIADKEALLRMALDNMPGAMWVVDRDSKLVMANDQYKEFYGDTNNIVRPGTSIEAILRQEAEAGRLGQQGSVSEIVGQRLESYRSGVEASFEDLTRDGHNIRLTRRPTDAGFVVSIATDITEVKEKEAQLRKAFTIISESIQYASRIQRSVLPTDAEMSATFEDYFSIWEPKDMVGGDVYLLRPCDRGTLLMVADCTGHGVPGAFMSMIATGSLDLALIENPSGDPAALLGRINRLVKTTLGQEGRDGESDDGFECGLCLLDRSGKTMTYAGARFELWEIKDGEMTAIKGDKPGVGYRRTAIDQAYTNHEIDVSSTAMYYLFTDGLTDQPGGPKRRAFGKNRLKSNLLDYYPMQLTKQEVHLMREFEEYQHKEERRDDVTFLGFVPRAITDV